MVYMLFHNMILNNENSEKLKPFELNKDLQMKTKFCHS